MQPIINSLPTPARTVSAMTFEAGASDSRAARLSDDDPLPPEDRVVDARQLSLEILYRAHAPRLQRLFGRRAGRQDADDLVQDSFVRFADAGVDRALHKPEAYLTRVATNMLRNRARAAFHRSVVQNDIADHPLAGATDMTPMLEIFMAHRLDGATYGEIAARMGLSVKGVEWHMTKAIAHLHRAAGQR